MAEARGRPEPQLDPDAMLVFGRARSRRRCAERGAGARRAALDGEPPPRAARGGAARAARRADRTAVLRSPRSGRPSQHAAKRSRPCSRMRPRACSVARRDVAGTLRIAAAPVFAEEVCCRASSRHCSRTTRVSRSTSALSVDYVDLRRADVDVALRAWPLDDASDLFAVKLGTSVTGCWASPVLRSRARAAREALRPRGARLHPRR